jgi:Cof subfamily protein (haloacid dehalogenase superfamily)
MDGGRLADSAHPYESPTRAAAPARSRGPDGLRPAVVASDLDGTLLASHGALSPATADELRTLDGEGVVVVALTARPARLLRRCEPLWSLVRYAVCDNGATTWDTRSDRLVAATSWGLRDLELIAGELRLRVPPVSLALETAEGMIAEQAFARLAGHPIEFEIVRTVRVLSPGGGPATKLMAIADGYAPDVLCRALAAGMTMRCRPTHSGGAFVEIGPPGTGKAAALARLCARWGVDAADVVAFGDMPNDADLLAWAGVGVAMGNAHPSVLACADAVTLSNDEDGVARWLAALRPAAGAR